jgi:oxalate decarboxylase/phosphoglucose isomerase-like protein (cupin superfamily)
VTIVEPTSHRVRNVGTSTFDVLDVQLLSRPPGPAVDPIAAPVAENTSIAYRFELASGAEVRHSHQRPYLLIAVTDAQLSVSQSGGEPRQATLRVGDVDWVSVPRAHTIVNRGGDRVMFVEIELK